MNNLYIEIENIIRNNLKSALCIVTETSGSTPRKVGTKMIVYENNKISGTIGGGAIEKQVIVDAIDAIKNNEPQKRLYQLEKELSMQCGGNMEVYIEPLIQTNDLYIFGAGHIGKAVANYAKDLNFNIFIIDWRDVEFTESERQNYHYIKGDLTESIENLKFDSNTYSIILTPTHETDEEVLAILGKKPFAYLGMIGSKRKVAVISKKLIDNYNYTEKEITKFDMPIGIPIKAETPNEIAVSIIAKIIDVRNSKK